MNALGKITNIGGITALPQNLELRYLCRSENCLQHTLACWLSDCRRSSYISLRPFPTIRVFLRHLQQSVRASISNLLFFVGQPPGHTASRGMPYRFFGPLPLWLPSTHNSLGCFPISRILWTSASTLDWSFPHASVSHLLRGWFLILRLVLLD